MQSSKMGFIDLPPNPVAAGKLKISIELNKEELQKTVDFIRSAAQSLSEKREKEHGDNRCTDSQPPTPPQAQGTDVCAQDETQQICTVQECGQNVPLLSNSVSNPASSGTRPHSKVSGEGIVHVGSLGLIFDNKYLMLAFGSDGPG